MSSDRTGRRSPVRVTALVASVLVMAMALLAVPANAITFSRTSSGDIALPSGD